MLIRTGDTPSYERLGPEQCWALLASEPVGRLGLSIGARPAVLPVLFAVLDRSIVFRAGAGSRLEAATSSSVIAFEADHYDPETRAAWSILVRGVAERIVAPDELARVRALELESWAEPWTHHGGADRYVRIPPTVVTGRVVRPAEGAEGAAHGRGVRPADG